MLARVREWVNVNGFVRVCMCVLGRSCMRVRVCVRGLLSEQVCVSVRLSGRFLWKEENEKKRMFVHFLVDVIGEKEIVFVTPEWKKVRERDSFSLSLSRLALPLSVSCWVADSQQERERQRERQNDDQIEKEEKKSKNLVALGASNLINTASSLAGIKDWKLNLKD